MKKSASILIRVLWALSLVLLVSCGSKPGLGPTAADIAQRTKGHEVRTLRSFDNKELGYIVHQPAQPAQRRAAFIYIHGIESHSGWFDEAARQIALRGYPVFSLDRRGSGINRENRGFLSGHVKRGVDLVDDIRRAVQITRSSEQVDEVYLIGLSWGGKYCMAYDATYPNEVDGMILITPGMKPEVDLRAGEKIGVAMDAVFAPTRQHRTPIQPEMFTTTPKYLSYIKEDPLRLRTVSASFLIQSVRMDRLVDKQANIARPPMLVFLAGRDRIIDNDATRELVTRNPNRSVKIIEYPEQTHSIQLDAPVRMTRDLLQWLDSIPPQSD